jgi:hypothetical protein
MTDGALSTIKNWTGVAFTGGCPWRPLMNDPLVHEVLAAWPFFENGTLALYNPNPSHRLMEGLRALKRARDACKAEASELDYEAAKRGRS